MSNDNLWGPLSSEENSNKEKSLDEIMREDASGESQGTSLADDGGKRKLALVGAGTALVLAVGGIFFLNPFSGADLFGPDGKEKVEQIPPLKQANNGETTDPVDNTPWYNEPQNYLPIDQPEWAQELGSLDATAITDEQRQWVDEAVGDTRLGTLSSINLPSEELGYTADPDKATDENGLPNPNYSYWTAELFQDQSTLITNKLLNPAYGGWTQYQYSNANASRNFDLGILSDVVTPGYMKKLQGNRAATPLYADWAGNDYGLNGTIINSGGPRWVGEITNADIAFTYDEKALGYVADATYQVTFTTWTQDQKKLTRKGTLKLKFVTDNEAVENNKSFRMLVSGGSLSVK